MRTVNVEAQTPPGEMVTVTNASGDSILPYKVELVAKLDGHGDGPYSFSYISELGMDTDTMARLYVLDGKAVKVFDRRGQHVRTLGRQGSGPGEFELPFQIAVLTDGGAFIWDRGKRAIIQYSGEGLFVDELHVPGVLDNRMDDMSISRKGLAAKTRTFAGIPNRNYDGNFDMKEVLYLMPFDSATGWGNALQVAALDFSDNRRIDEGCSNATMRIARPVFSTDIRWSYSDYGLAYVTTAEYSITLVRSDGVRFTVKRKLPLVRANERLAAEEVGELLFGSLGDGVPDCRLSPIEHARRRGWAEHVPWIKDLLLMHDGTLLVLRRERSEPSQLRTDVFDSNGSYLGTMPPEIPWTRAWLSPTEYVVLQRDQYDVPVISIYRLVGPSDRSR